MVPNRGAVPGNGGCGLETGNPIGLTPTLRRLGTIRAHPKSVPLN
jgi:hypothetical protein